MKPSEDNELKQAVALFRSPRGQYILAEALFVAINTMKKVENVHREESNIRDMELLSKMFEPYFSVTSYKNSD